MKTLYRSNSQFGSIEFSRADELTKLDAIGALSAIITPGIVVSFDANNVMGDEWKPFVKTETEFHLLAGKAVLVDADGNLVPVEWENTIYTPDQVGSGLKYVYLKHNPSSYEKGTVSFTDGSEIVTGNGTEFTKIFGANRRIIVGSQVFSVAGVVDDEELVLAEAFDEVTPISEAQFKVGAWFLGTPPVSLNDNLIYQYNEAQIVFSGTTISTPGYYLLATVTTALSPTEALEFTGGTDMRHKSLFKFQKPNGTMAKVRFNTLVGSATEIEVYPGQTLNFPESYTADFNTILVSFPVWGNQTAIGIKYTGRTNNKLTGVTWDSSYPLSPAPTILANGGIVFTPTTFTQDDSIKIGQADIKYSRSVTTVANSANGLGASVSYLTLKENLQVDADQIVLGTTGLFHMLRVQGIRNNYSSYEIDYGNGSSSGDFVIKRNGGTLFKINGTTGVVTFYGNLSADGQTLDCSYVKAMQVDLKGLQTAPATQNEPGNVGEIRFAADGIYFCVATNTWKKATLSSF